MVVRTEPTSISCGLRMIGGETSYTDPEVFMLDFARAVGTSGYTQFVYSHRPDQNKIGWDIEQYIVKNRLGTVVRSAPGNNPIHPGDANTQIVVWTWTRDVNAFNTHVVELQKRRDAKVLAERKAREEAKAAAKAQQAASDMPLNPDIAPPPKLGAIFGKAGQ